LKALFLTLLWSVFIIDAVLLVLIVLLQSGRGGGISGMLGGGGGAESALGPKSGLNKITGWMAGVFFAAAILIGLLAREEAAIDVETGPVQEAQAASGGPQEGPDTPDAPDPVEKPSTGKGADAPPSVGEKAPDDATDTPPEPPAEK
jgi:preprotein translocase subunit SecG